MSLILAIDNDRRQAAQLAKIVRQRLQVELLQAASTAEAIRELGDRVPDLVLTSPLLSPWDEGVLAEHLRDLGPAAAHVQTLRIPVFGTAKPRATATGVMSRLRWRSAPAPTSGGCDPKLFAEEIAEYLKRAAEEKESSNNAAERNAPLADAMLPASAEALEGHARASAQDPFDEFLEQVADERVVAAAIVPVVAEPIAIAPADEPGTIWGPATEPDAAEPGTIWGPATEPDAIERHVEPIAMEVEPVAPLVIEPDPVEPVVMKAAAVEPVEMQAAAIAPLVVEPVAIEPAAPEVLVPAAAAAPAPVVDDLPAWRFVMPPQEPAVHVPEPEPNPVATLEAVPVAPPSSITNEAALEELPAAAVQHDVDRADSQVETASVASPLLTAPTEVREEPSEMRESFRAALAAIRAAWRQAPGRESSTPLSINPATVPIEPAEKPVSQSVDEAPMAADAGPEIDLTGELEAAAPAASASTDLEQQPEPERVVEDAPVAATAAATPSAEEEVQPVAAAAMVQVEEAPAAKPRKKQAKPVQDEWGIFDPAQCGFSALLDKLDEVTSSGEDRKRAGVTVRLITH